MSAPEGAPGGLGWNVADLRQDRQQEIHADRIGRVYLGIEGDAESRRRAVARIEWMLTTCLPGRLLDIGCSEGILCILAAGRGHEAEGWDINPGSVDAARAFASDMVDESGPQPKFAVQDVFAVDELSPHFDNVVLGEVLEHVFEPEALVRRAVLALRDGGKLIITTPWGHFPAPDHHQTFTLTRFLSVVPEVISWESLDVVDGYIRFAGTRAFAPGSGDDGELREENAARFPAQRLLEISERAAISSQRFLRRTLADRYSQWETARDAADRHHAATQEALKVVNSLKAEVARVTSERDAATRQVADLRAELHAEKDRLELEVTRLADLAATAAAAAELAELSRDTAVRTRQPTPGAAGLADGGGALQLVEPALGGQSADARSRRAWRGRLGRSARRVGRGLRRVAASQPSLRAGLLDHLPDRLILRLDRATRSTTEDRRDRGPVVPAVSLDLQVRHGFAERADLILVCGAYPDGTDRYGGEFLRSRVECYRSVGIRTLVVSIDQRHAATSHVELAEADLLQVPPDRADRLDTLLSGTRRRPIAVHAPTPEVGRLFLGMAGSHPTAFFFHGAEARDYRRLHFNFSTEEMELRRGRLDRANADRAAFMRAAASSSNAQLVFVSDYLRSVAEADFGLDLGHAHIIHNVIDGESFGYRERKPDERRRLLLVRSFQQRNYGNDIALKALELLLDEPELADLKVTIRGFGQDFAPLTQPLRDRPNVDVSEGYVDARTLRRLHDEHGVFLVPSRHDTQGVSMGEAMASGLVCVTNRVAAIPEFASESEAVLVEGESAQAYAAALRKLVEDADGFTRRSVAAARRVRQQCGFAATIDRELKLLGLKADA